MTEKNIITKVEAAGEGWSWSKFFGGFFNGVNSAKAIVTTFHQILILLIVASLIFCGVAVWKKFKKKPKGTPAPVCVTTNNGEIHSSTDEIVKKYGLVNLF